MAFETTPASSLTRYRPVVLAIAGFAAAYGAYTVYTNLTPPSPAGIHRSNAVVHRPRRPVRPRRQQESQPEPSTEQASGAPDFSSVDTYGRWELVDGNGQSVQIELQPNNLPTLESLQHDHSLSEEQAQAALTAIHREFVSRFIMMQFQNRGTRANWEQETISAAQWLGQRGFSAEEVQEGMAQMTRIVEQEVIARGETADEADTIAGTEVGPVQFRRAGSGLNLKQLLYHIAENQARQDGYIHRGIRCDSCGTLPIRGTRWKCANCVDLDLCNECHTTCMHSRNHIFYEIRIPTYDMNNLHPVQDLSYPGRPDLSKVPPLPANICRRLVEMSDFEKAEIEGLYDQFSCLAGTPRPNDELQFAIDRHTFQQALLPLSSSSPLRPNLIFDRMFSLFDKDSDGLVSFEEFVIGVAFLRSRSQGRRRWKKIFLAYDIDEDGFVTRSDFLRMFRALFTLQKAITHDLLSRNEAVNSLREAANFASSGRVISSAFTQNPRSVGEPRSPLNKTRNEYGDVRHQERQSVVKNDLVPEVGSEEIVGNAWESQAQLPFDLRTGEPLSLRDFLYLAPRDQRGQAPSHIARDQRVHFSYEGQSVAAARRAAWQERWKKREFYEDVGSPQSETIEVGDYEIPVFDQGRVGDVGRDVMYHVLQESLNELLDPLFKSGEDLALEIETAKPEMDRWKTEIEDYNNRKREEQQQAERVARDPLMATAAAAEKEAKVKQNGHPHGPTNVSSTRDTTTMADTITSIEEQVQAQPLGELLDGQGFAIREDESTLREGVATHLDIAAPPPQSSGSMRLDSSGIITGASVFGATPVQPEARFDPTMPQFMPNSERDIAPRDVTVDPLQAPTVPSSSENTNLGHRPKFEAEIIRQFEFMFLGWERGDEGKVVNGATKHTLQRSSNQRPDETEPPSEERLTRLAELQVQQEAIKARGGPGKISFDEFAEFISLAKGSDFKFLDSWLEVCYF